MTQGKIERYHRSMKNVLLLENYYSPPELEQQIGLFVDHYNNDRYHEALNDVAPVDVYHGRDGKLLQKRAQVKRKNLMIRRRQNCGLWLVRVTESRYKEGKPSLSSIPHFSKTFENIHLHQIAVC